MRRTGRWRKFAKWAGVGACAVILVAWGVSLEYYVLAPLGKGTDIAFSGGLIVIAGSFEPSILEFDIEIGRNPPGHHLDGFKWPIVQLTNTSFYAKFPCWLLLLVSAIPTTFLFYRDRQKIRPGCCQQCGYDLRTMTDGRCPECGLAADVTGVA